MARSKDLAALVVFGVSLVKLRPYVWVLIILAGCAAGGYAYLVGFEKSKPAPDVTFTTLQGERFALRDLRGHPVLVTFWASDCPSCLVEIPHLVELFRDYGPRGLRIIAVAMHYDMPSRVVELAKTWALPYPVAFDVQRQYAQAFFGVSLIPASFLVSPAGTITFHHVGLLDMSALRRRIDLLLEGT